MIGCNEQKKILQGNRCTCRTFARTVRAHCCTQPRSQRRTPNGRRVRHLSNAGVRLPCQAGIGKSREHDRLCIIIIVGTLCCSASPHTHTHTTTTTTTTHTLPLLAHLYLIPSLRMPRTSPGTTTAAWMPQFTDELKNGVEECLELSAQGDCPTHEYGVIGEWDVSYVPEMTRMFYSARSFDSDISKWNPSFANDMYGMFWRATSFNGDISKWDV